MVAFSFQERFAGAVRSGAKRQTIRARARVSPGQRVQLYAGMRTKRCRKLAPDRVCTLVWPVGLDVTTCGFGEIIVNGMRLFGADRERFAREDGFASLAEMHAFWLDRHGVGRFKGVLVRWALPLETTEEAEMDVRESIEAQGGVATAVQFVRALACAAEGKDRLTLMRGDLEQLMALSDEIEGLLAEEDA